MGKKSFNLYKSWSPLILNMDPEQAGLLFQSIYQYQEDGTEPETSSSIYPMFCLMKAKFDEDEETYQKTCENNKRIANERESTKRNEPSRSVTKRDETLQQATDTDTDTDNDTDTKKDKEREREPRKRVAFTPPTVEEVKAYCKERNNNVDAERFVDFYQSKGWVIGKDSKMKDWKACVRTWENRETARSGTTKEAGYIRQTYDFDSIEHTLIAN